MQCHHVDPSYDSSKDYFVKIGRVAFCKVYRKKGGLVFWGPDFPLKAFGGGAFDGVSIWMGPFNAGVVVRVGVGW